MAQGQRLPIVATLITFLAVVIMFALGLWQLQRADEKNQRQNMIAQASSSDPLQIETAKQMGESARDFPVRLLGLADSQRYFLLDNRIQEGRVGYEVLTVVNSQQGNVVVNLGWLAAPALRADLPQVSIASEQQTYEGMLSIPQKNNFISETAVSNQQWPKLLQQIDVTFMEQIYGQELLPFVILLDESSDSDFVRKWQPVVMPPEKHIAYAIQWFLLAFAALIIFVIAQRRKFIRETK
ncbi:SURF1 family protein [Paraglaciecola sp. 25GB23A]|uniref:SURF1 family protein n=1 Tax=Paraglaciecola sp. 25GB23A TaxID=3156068 RepID=UPI0032AF2049